MSYLLSLILPYQSLSLSSFSPDYYDEREKLNSDLEHVSKGLRL
jgi:hypothetical protein